MTSTAFDIPAIHGLAQEGPRLDNDWNIGSGTAANFNPYLRFLVRNKSRYRVRLLPMGVWGTGIFDRDIACDIRGHYREQIEDGVEDEVALRATLAEYANFLADPEDGPVCIIALAITQSKIGRLDPDIRTRALAAIDGGADLALWEAEDPASLAKRQKALAKARAELTGPQPKRKRLRPPRRQTSGLAAGDVLALRLPPHLLLLRVVRIYRHRLGEWPILEELEFDGLEVPSPDEIERLQPPMKPPYIPTGFEGPRFTAFIARDKIGWEQAGFQKVASSVIRPGDEEEHIPSSGICWTIIGDSFLRKR